MESNSQLRKVVNQFSIQLEESKKLSQTTEDLLKFESGKKNLNVIIYSPMSFFIKFNKNYLFKSI